MEEALIVLEVASLQRLVILRHGIVETLGHCRTVVTTFGGRILVWAIEAGHIGQHQDGFVAAADHERRVSLHIYAALGGLDAQFGAEMDASVRIVMETIGLALLELRAICHVALGVDLAGLHADHAR